MGRLATGTLPFLALCRGPRPECVHAHSGSWLNATGERCCYWHSPPPTPPTTCCHQRLHIQEVHSAAATHHPGASPGPSLLSLGECSGFAQGWSGHCTSPCTRVSLLDLHRVGATGRGVTGNQAGSGIQGHAPPIQCRLPCGPPSPDPGPRFQATSTPGKEIIGQKLGRADPKQGPWASGLPRNLVT